MMSFRAIVLLLLTLGLVTPAAAAAGAPTPASAPVPARAATDGPGFTIAVIPDTQGEVFGADKRLPHRNRWLVKRRDALDLRFVAQVGDLTNWGWLDRAQLRRASRGFQILDDAGVPYAIAVGNHDTRAVGWDGRGGYGGAAYVDNPECRDRFSAQECRTEVLVRRTEEINEFFDAERFGAVRGAYEPGKIDNLYSTFRVDGLRWMVLDLELWPRKDAVVWADRVVRAHPRHNVIVNTHSYLTAGGAISTSAEYGSTSPRYLWDTLVSRHRNIVMVLSGHTGQGATRVDRGVHGNKVVSMLTNLRQDETNPVRLVRVDPGSNTLATRVLGPFDDTRYPKLRSTVRGMRFVR
jgi:hypothetical protein